MLDPWVSIKDNVFIKIGTTKIGCYRASLTKMGEVFDCEEDERVSDQGKQKHHYRSYLTAKPIKVSWRYGGKDRPTS